jgi:hypothetical protein
MVLNINIANGSIKTPQHNVGIKEKHHNTM